MLRVSVPSRSIRSVGYDPATRILEIMYVNGGLYEYIDVPREEHRALMGAESKGAYVNLRIKPHYECRRVLDRVV